MRILIQRVKEAKVMVGDEVTGQIGPGLLVFLGIHRADTEADIPWLVQKLIGLRIFNDDAGKFNKNVQDVDGGILVVSQFTLYGNCKNGRRPDFIQSANGEDAQTLYDAFVRSVRETYGSCETGRFAAAMEVSLVNDGPVTLMIDGKASL